jgi:outer membrane protein TolC
MRLFPPICQVLCCFVWIIFASPTTAQEKDLAPPRLTLSEVFRLAWKENANIKISRLKELVADQDIVRARSGYLPKVDAKVGHNFYDLPSKFKFSPGFNFPTTDGNYWSSQVIANQTIYDFGATSSRYRQAQLGKEVARMDTAATRDDIFLMAAQLYFQVLRSEKLVTVAEQEVVQLREHLKIAQDLFEFGVVTQNDVLQAQVALADAQQRLISIKNSVISHRGSLNKLVGIPVHQATRLQEETGITLPVWNLEGATQVALDTRSDLKAADRRVVQGEKGVTEAQSGYFPKFFAQAGHTYQKNASIVNDSQYFAILGMQWNLFSGMDTRAQVAQARQKVEQLLIHKQDLADQVQLDVQNAYLALKETAERIAVTKDAVTQGQENLRLNEERYKEQVGTATDVIDAQTLLTRTRVNYLNAIFDHQFAKTQMLRVVGKINDLAPPP